MPVDYPRVLLLVKARVSEVDNSGASLGKWFAEWPRQRLAQLYSGGSTGTAAFCAREYQLTGSDRRLGGLFDRLKGPVLASTHVSTAGPRQESQASAVYSWIKRVAGGAVIASGLWEIAFAPRLSPALRAWITEFGPQVLYVQPSDLSFMQLAILINREFGVPVCVAMPDDFPAFLYRRSPLLRQRVAERFTSLIALSGARLSTGEAMSKQYRERYGVEFQPLMMCDDPARFDSAAPRRLAHRDTFVVLYSGSLVLGRWRALLDLTRAARAASTEDRRIEVHALVPAIPAEAEAALRDSGLVLHEPPADSELPSLLKGADLLFLPESFDEADRRATRLSISTKAHLYMMSGRPIIVYGPRGAGVVEYAREEGWARVVDREGAERLIDAITELQHSAAAARFCEAGRRVAAKNHAAAAVRERLRSTLSNVACPAPLLAGALRATT